MGLLTLMISTLLVLMSPSQHAWAALHDAKQGDTKEATFSTGSLHMSISATQLELKEGETVSLVVTNEGTLEGKLFVQGDVVVNGLTAPEWISMGALLPGSKTTLQIGSSSSGPHELKVRLVQSNRISDGFLDERTVSVVATEAPPVEEPWPDLSGAYETTHPYYLMEPYYYGDHGGLSSAIVYIAYEDALPFDSKLLMDHLKSHLSTWGKEEQRALIVKEAVYVTGKGVKLELWSNAPIKQLNLQVELKWYNPDGSYRGNFQFGNGWLITYGRRIFTTNDYFPNNKHGVNEASVLKIGGDNTVQTRIVTSIGGWNDPVQTSEESLPKEALNKLTATVSNDAFTATLSGDVLTITQTKNTTEPASVTLFYDGKTVLTRSIQPSTAFMSLDMTLSAADESTLKNDVDEGVLPKTAVEQPLLPEDLEAVSKDPIEPVEADPAEEELQEEELHQEDIPEQICEMLEPEYSEAQTDESEASAIRPETHEEYIEQISVG